MKRALNVVWTLAITVYCVHQLSTGPYEVEWIILAVLGSVIPAMTGKIGPVLGFNVGLVGTLWFTHPAGVEKLGTGYALLFAVLQVVAVAGWVRRAWRKARRVVEQAPGGRPKLLGLAGYAQSGKDTAAAFLVADGWERRAFADKLKAVAYDLNPWVCTSGGMMIRLAELVDRAGWEEAKKHADVRNLLQDLGVAVRDHLHPDIWVFAALKDLPADKHVVITDCRFPNEADAVAKMGGMVARVERPGVAAVNRHQSESALTEYKFHAVIPNDSSVEDLAAKVRALTQHVGSRR